MTLHLNKLIKGQRYLFYKKIYNTSNEDYEIQMFRGIFKEILGHSLIFTYYCDDTHQYNKNITWAMPVKWIEKV